MIFYYYLPFLFLVLVFLYLKIYIKRIVSLFIKNNKKNKLWTFLILMIVILPAINLWGMWALYLGVFVLISFVCDIFYKLFHNKNKYIKKIYELGLTPIILTSFIFIYGYININNVVETKYDLYTTKEIRNKGYKIIFISDLHYGSVMDKDVLEKSCNKISLLNPDIVILGGDIVDENTSLKEMKEVFTIISKIKSNYGIYYVYGNHDRQDYALKKSYNINELNGTIKRNGIVILKDDNRIINNDIVIIGRNDYSETRLNPLELLDNVDNSKYLLIVYHRPIEIEDNASSKYDLMLSGHTHNGQVWPLNYIAKSMSSNNFSYGFERFDKMDLIVSSGMSGWKYKIRTAGDSEFVLVNLINR